MAALDVEAGQWDDTTADSDTLYYIVYSLAHFTHLVRPSYVTDTHELLFCSGETLTKREV